MIYELLDLGAVIVVVVVLVVVVVVDVVVVAGLGGLEVHGIAPSCSAMQRRFDNCSDMVLRTLLSQLFVQSL